MTKAVFFAICTFLFLSVSCTSTKLNSSIKKLPECAEDEIAFVDYFGDIQICKINTNLKKNEYKAEFFRREKSKMLYEDKNFTVRQGIDISRHDKKVNWQKVRKAGFDFVILRAAWRGYESGILHEDENFKKNIQGAISAGFDVGVYVFSQAINEKEASEEADFVLDLIKDYKITLPVVFDPENIGWEEARTDNVSAEQFTKNAIIFCKKIQNAGYEPMIYANLTWQMMRLDLEQLSEYKMWYADYSDIPQTPYHFNFWQHYSPKRVPGVQKKCDVNIMIEKLSD